MPLWLKILLSVLLVAGVIIGMWRIPRRGESYFGFAPPLALLSVWVGLGALIFSAALWMIPRPDPVIALLFLAVDPIAIGSGTLVFWIYRRYETAEETVHFQRLQAKVGIVLGIVAVVADYWFVFTHKPPLTG